MSICFKPNWPFWTPCVYLKEPKVGKLDSIWFILLPLKGFRVTWTFAGPHLVSLVISASGCVNWTPSRLPKRECFLPNLRLRLNFAIANYLFKTNKFDNITGPGDEEVAEAGRRHFPHEKAKIWQKIGKNWVVLGCFRPLPLSVLGWLNTSIYQFDIHSLFTNRKLRKLKKIHILIFDDFCCFFLPFFTNSVLQLKILKKWCKNEPNQCKIYQFTNMQLSKKV